MNSSGRGEIVSMSLNGLLRWGAIRKVYEKGSRKVRYEAEPELRKNPALLLATLLHHHHIVRHRADHVRHTQRVAERHGHRHRCCSRNAPIASSTSGSSVG